MDKYTRAYYELVFERNFLRCKGTEFQNSFGDLLEKRFPNGDFIRVRPWGRAGDRKNDGYLKSQKTLFGVYAPNEMTESKAITKIDQDFYGALPHWKEHFDTWTFVHNDREGLGPGITKKLLDLDQEHNEISVNSWGYQDLRRLLFELPEEDIAALLGPAPSQSDFLQVGFSDLQVVLDFISRQEPSPTPDLKRVPQDKIEINKLSEETKSLINAGGHKSLLVGQFLQQYPDPEYGDQVVQTFKSKYNDLKITNLDPDTIFRELQVFAGGERMQTPKLQAAVLSVLAYLFDQCDIFEPSGDK